MLDSADRITLFNNIATFVYDQLHASEPALKRRRVDEQQPSGGFATLNGKAAASGGASMAAASGNAADEQVQLEIKEISISVPQRKKFDLCFTDNFLYARPTGTTTPAQGIVYSWADIGKIFWYQCYQSTRIEADNSRVCILPTRTRKIASSAQLRHVSARQLLAA
jgi:hypothetical protein